MKHTNLPIASLLLYALTVCGTAHATDLVINVSQEKHEVKVLQSTNVDDIKAYVYANGEPVSAEDRDRYLHEHKNEAIGRKNTQLGNQNKNQSWFAELFASNNEPEVFTPVLDGDEQNILLNKDFLDPDEHIIQSKKRWEQSIIKKVPNQIAEPFEFFNAKPPVALSSRMYIDERSGKIYFLVNQGSLKDNVNLLMAETRNTKHLIWKVGNHKVFSEYWVSGNSMFELINNLLAPYKQPDQVMFGVFLGNTIGIFYHGDKEFWL